MMQIATDLASRSRADVAEVSSAFHRLAPALRWEEVPRGSDAGGGERIGGYRTAVIAGPDGLEERSDVWIGATLLAPNAGYPTHQHAPEEVYLFMSPGRLLLEDGMSVEAGAGQLVYNRPDCLHALASTTEPLLVLWFLPLETLGLLKEDMF